MSIHYPRPGKEQFLWESMRRFGAAMRNKPGNLGAYSLKDEKTGRLVGLALWDSKEDWEAARPAMMEAVKGDDFDAWEKEPPDVFHLADV